MRTAVAAAVTAMLLCIVTQGGLLRPAYDPVEHSDRMMRAIDDGRPLRIALAELEEAGLAYEARVFNARLRTATREQRGAILDELAAKMEAGEIDPAGLSPYAAELAARYALDGK